MKELPIRKFTTVVGFLTEPTTITNNGEAIGQFLPKVWLDKVPTIKLGETTVRPALDLTGYKEEPVDDVKKAIEPDKVKESKGRLTKGLGDIPGETEKRVDPQIERNDRGIGWSRPAPKPGKSK